MFQYENFVYDIFKDYEIHMEIHFSINGTLLQYSAYRNRLCVGIHGKTTPFDQKSKGSKILGHVLHIFSLQKCTEITKLQIRDRAGTKNGTTNRPQRNALR